VAKPTRIPTKKAPTKTVLIRKLEETMTEEQWNLISLIRGHKIKTTSSARCAYLSRILKRTKITITAAKEKSKNLQKWACERISRVTGLRWGQDEDIASRRMGEPGPDVVMSPLARRLWPFTIECKSGNKWDLPYAIRQAQRNLYPNTDWMVIVDRPSLRPGDAFPPIVVMDGEKFFIMMQKIYGDWLKSREG